MTRIGAEWRTARTPKRCACGGEIRKGERYFREVWKDGTALETTLEGDHIHEFEREEARMSLDHRV